MAVVGLLSSLRDIFLCADGWDRKKCERDPFSPEFLSEERRVE